VVDAPQPCDLGFADPFYGTQDPCGPDQDEYGIRCIYNWWREQNPVLDCYDVDRVNGLVNIDDILMTSSAYGSHAGQVTGGPPYHPDADVNHDGSVNVLDDIIAVAGQFGHACQPPQHYLHS
jgi:hypothetical protein